MCVISLRTAAATWQAGPALSACSSILALSSLLHFNLFAMYYQPIIQMFFEKTLEMDQKPAQLDLLYFCISAKNHQGTHAQAMDGHISSFKGFYGLELLNVVYKVLKEDAARAKGFKG